MRSTTPRATARILAQAGCWPRCGADSPTSSSCTPRPRSFAASGPRSSRPAPVTQHRKRESARPMTAPITTHPAHLAATAEGRAEMDGQLLSETFVELTDTLVVGFDVVDLLH